MPKIFEELSRAVLDEAKKRNKKISCAESCTGGLVGASLTEIPGSSEVFNGSAVVYSNEAKNKILGVSKNILQESGAVSEPCAIAMAEGALRIYESDFSVSITGIAGPDGGSNEKPVGTVWIGVAKKGGKSYAELNNLKGNRNSIREESVKLALKKLYETIVS